MKAFRPLDYFEIALTRADGYPFDLPGAFSRALPSYVIPLKLCSPTTHERDMPIMSDCDESGLVAIHEGVGTDDGYTVTHPPTGVAYRQELTLEEALDLAGFLVARLQMIRQLELDYSTHPDPARPATCRIASDPGGLIPAIEEWEDGRK